MPRSCAPAPKVPLKVQSLVLPSVLEGSDGDGLGGQRLVVDGDACLGVALKGILGQRQHQRVWAVAERAAIDCGQGQRRRGCRGD